ncbi:filamentous hemagglutinin [Paraburkholderia tropica]|uniref:hemagglutinin repeat-containing protein n=1 Tax=Paraburkholderia tropica TaxID=92647 RepID=UPI0016130362|nr:hemagglutinin repeat-containing protein [Paraburkholderia tropica]MBB3005271.1 filamentous hemagglutinin [Paraburkholderia tropica]
MNKNIHRVVFNAVRGLWTAVQETAKAVGKGCLASALRGTRAACARLGRIDMLAMRHAAFAALCVFGMQPVLAEAQVVAAPTAGSKPAVGVTANGLPIVQITAPNGAGVSNNTYSQYNVGANGLILNNASGNVQTQQAGYVAANPNLVAGGARVIVNQVVGGGASQLLGYTEVAGQRADVVIANPAGIYCNGCGFINTNRGVLTTGTPIFGGTGSLDAFHVTGGQIQIGSAGLNASSVDQVDLIARSVAVNGKIWAGQSLNVVAGNNDVRYGDLSAQSLRADGSSPGVAIDVAQLGGMYAGKIMLEGTEAGVGVNSAGTLAAQSGDLQLSSQGKVTLSGTTSASGNVSISSSGGTSNIGSVYATQNAVVSSQGQVVNGGTIAALGNASVVGASVNSSGTLGAGIDASGNATGTGSLSVSGAGAVTLGGQQLAGGDLAVAGSSLNMTGATTEANGSATLVSTGAGGDSGNILHSGASLQVGGTLTAHATGTLTNDQGQTSAAQLNVTAGSISNRGGTLSQTGAGEATLTASGAFDNTGGALKSNGQNTTIRSGGLANANGSITSVHALNLTSSGDIDNTAGQVEAAGAVNVSGANVQNAAGRIVSDNSDGLSLTASGQLANTAGTTAQGATGGLIGGNGNATIHAASLASSGTITAAQALAVTTSGALDNSGGSMSATALQATAGSIRNANGAFSGDTVSIDAPKLDNSGGNITANQLDLSATTLTNRGGTLTQLGTAAMGVSVSSAIDNSAGGVIQTSSSDLTLNPASLNNDGGTITHAGTGTLTIGADGGPGAVTNVGGKIATNGQATISAGSLDDSGGTISAQRGLTATVAGDLNNAGGQIETAGDLSVESGASITNTSGTIAASGNAAIQANALVNGGSITTAQTLKATVGGALDNSSGTLSAQTITASAASFKNASGVVSGDSVSMTVPQLDNSNGRILTNQLAVTATSLANQGGSITQLGSDPISLGVSGTIDNSNGGVIQSNSSDLALASASLDNDGGTITHAGTGTLTIAPGSGTGTLTNVGGNIVTNGQASVTVGTLDNTGGSLASQGVMSAIVRGVLNNTNARLSSGTGLTASSGGELINAGGIIGAGGAAAGSTLNLSASSLNNAGGAISNVGSGDTTINGGSQIINTNAGGVAGMGSISGNGQVTLAATSIANTQGGQLSGANLQVNAAGNLDNTGGEIGNVAQATGDVGIATGTLASTGGQINSARNLSLTVNTLAGGGAFSAVNDLSMNLQGSFTTSAAYRFDAGHDLTFTLPGTFSNGGALSAVSNLNVNAGTIKNSGSMQAGGKVTTYSATLNNTGTIVGGSVSLNATTVVGNIGTSALIGATDSAGTLEVLAPDIENRDDSTATDTQATTAIYGLGKVVLAGGKNADGSYTNATLIHNQSGLIQSGGDMVLAADKVSNTRRELTTTGFTSSIDPALLESLGISMSGCTSTQMAACAGQEVGWLVPVDPTLIGGAYTEPPHGGQWNSGYQYTTYTGVAVANTVATISPESQIVAGGNLNASSVVAFQNYWSQVAATGDIAAPLKIDNDSWAASGQMQPEVKVTYSGEYHYNNYDDSIRNWQLPFGDAGFVTSNPGGYSQPAPADIRYYTLPSYDSTYVARGTLSGTGVTINNSAGTAGVAPLGLLPGQTITGTGAGTVTGSLATTGGLRSSVATVQGGRVINSGLANFNNPTVAAATAVKVLNNLTVPSGGLFSADTAPNAPYLIETNPAFANQQKWLSSDYYFEQMGMNPGQTQMRLGDGFYEQQLVQNQILSMTGKSVLTNYADTQDEFEALMTSGAQLAKSLDLAPGTGLTPDQVAQLTSNVVIMQTQVVDGQSVLVPVVYLAQASQENMSNGPVIAATDIDLQDAQTVTNSGTITATNSFAISAQNIDSSFGTLQSGGQMSIVSAGNVNLTSATVNSGSLALQAGKDVILNTAVDTLHQSNGVGVTRDTSTLGPLASINVTGNAAIVTGGNLEQNAGGLNVGGALGMSIGGNWDLGVAQTGETKTVVIPNSVSDTHLVSNTGSSVKVGGASMIAVGGDLTASGATFDLGDGGTIAVAGDITLQAAAATSTIDASSSGHDHHGSYATSLHTSDDVVTDTTLHSGDSLRLVSGKDIDMIGSNIDLTKGTAALVAAGDVNIAAAAETHVSDFTASGSHSGVMSSTSRERVSNTASTQADGSLISADSVAISAGKNLNVIGSSIVGTDAVALAATGDVNLTAATETYQDNEYYQEKHSGFSFTGGLGVSVGSSEMHQRYDAGSVTQSQARSTVGASAGNVSIVAGGDLHIGGSDIVAGKSATDTSDATGNIALQAQNIVIDPGQDAAQSHDEQEAHSSGLTVAVTGTPLDTVKNLRADASSGNTFSRGQNTLEEIGASAADTPGISVSYGRSSSSSTTDLSSLTNAGSTLRAGGNVTVNATGGAVKDAAGNMLDGDITVTGSSVSARGTALFSANHDVTFQASTDQLMQSTQSSSSSSGFSLASASLGDFTRWVGGLANNSGVGPSPYNAASSSANGAQTANTQTASTVVANSVVVKSDTGDINVIGSGISGTQGVDLVASQGAINVLAGLDSSTNHQESSSKKIGDLGSNGTSTGFSVGVASNHGVEDSAAQTQSTMRSQIVSGNGNMTLDAKQDVTVQGSDLSAGGDLALTGKNLNLDPGTDGTQSSASQSSSQFGVSLALGGAVGNAVATINQSMNQASSTDNSRLKALDVAQAGLAAYNAIQVARASMSGPTAQPLIKATVSIGGGTSHGQTQQTTLANDGSTLTAGHDVTLVATGSGTKDASGAATDGDINASGTRISGHNVTLDAARDINLQSARDTSEQSSSNSSSNGSVGVGLAVGGQQNGFTVELAASMAHGNANGQSSTNQDTQIAASNTLSLTSGRDTNLRGAEMAGDSIAANVGRDLNVASQQDTSTYASKQTSGGFQASLCIPPICVGQTVSGSASFSQQTIDSDYQSVNLQSGFYAGNGGFDISVGNHTQLDGGVIASTASPELNNLSTQTLGFTNLENHASYSGDTVGLSASGGFGRSTKDGVTLSTPVAQGANHAPGPQTSQGLGPSGVSLSGTNSDASGTTYAAVSAGTITVRGDAGTGQDSTAGLSRDAANANGSVQNSFDAQKVQDDLAVQQQAGQVGMQIVGDVAQHLEQKANSDVDVAKARLDEAKASGDTAAQQQAQADLDAASLQASLWSNDGAARIASHAVVAGVGAALGGGNVAGAVGGTVAGDVAASYANTAFGNTLGGALLTNIISGAAGAAAGGVIGGGAGALSGAGGALSADLYNRQLHPDEKQKIHDYANGDKTEEDKLTKAACYVVQCWAQYPVGSAEYNANYVSQADLIGLQKELDWVNSQQAGNLFVYTGSQQALDFIYSQKGAFVNGLLNLVPGKHYADQAQAAAKNGDYGSAALLGVASLGDAALGVATGGEAEALEEALGWVRPSGWRLPASNGTWSGVAGDSNWISSNPAVNTITKGQPIPFKSGYPDFSQWSQGTFEIENMTGQSSDFGLVYDAVSEQFGLGSRTAGQDLLKELGLTPHHVEDGVTIQLVPSDLHGNVPHIGGASRLRTGMNND